MLIGIIVVVAIIAILVLYFIVTYNGFIKLTNYVSESFSQIDVQLKRRYDLIPNLVNTVKGYAKHEEQTLEKVINARNKILDGSPQERIDADTELQGALKSIFALSESYPDLKANENFLKLQDSLEETENKISYARQRYNSAVMAFNVKVQSIPSNIVAALCGFKTKDQLEIPETERENVQVEF